MGLTRRGFLGATVSAAALMGLSACGGSDNAAGGSGGGGDDAIVLGFSQVGAESGWRTANTKSIQDAAKDAGHRPAVLRRPAEAGEPDQGDPVVHPAEVDVIAFSPVVETGWDAVLKEAKGADIPVS